MDTSEATAYAPGRVELLGNHTDYNEGLALSAAIDRGLTVHGSKRRDGLVSFTSHQLGRRVETSLRTIAPQQGESAWANYPLGVVDQFLQAGCGISGFDAEITGDVPLGSGVSSSAALEVATALFLEKLNRIAFNRIEVARLCRRAENEFVGVPCGLLDQATSLFGEAGHLALIDFRSEKIATVPFPDAFALVIADSGVKHRLVEGEYRVRREQCQAAAARLGVPALRDATMEMLLSSDLDDVIKRRAAHIIGENERVSKAARLLDQGDVSAFGELLNASHESSRTNFENSTPELDLLVDAARSLPGVLGARLTGGGFGGGIVVLADEARAQEVADRLSKDYARTSGHEARAFVTAIGDGAA